MCLLASPISLRAGLRCRSSGLHLSVLCCKLAQRIDGTKLVAHAQINQIAQLAHAFGDFETAHGPQTNAVLVDRIVGQKRLLHRHRVAALTFDIVIAGARTLLGLDRNVTILVALSIVCLVLASGSSPDLSARALPGATTAVIACAENVGHQADGERMIHFGLLYSDPWDEAGVGMYSKVERLETQLDIHLCWIAWLRCNPGDERGSQEPRHLHLPTTVKGRYNCGFGDIYLMRHVGGRKAVEIFVGGWGRRQRVDWRPISVVLSRIFKLKLRRAKTRDVVSEQEPREDAGGHLKTLLFARRSVPEDEAKDTGGDEELVDKGAPVIEVAAIATGAEAFGVLKESQHT